MDFKILGPAVYQYPFSKDFAQDLVHMFETDDREEWKQSGIGVNSNQNQNMRTSVEYPFQDLMPISAEKVKQIFVSCVDHYCQNFETPVVQDEGFNLLKYEESIGKYDYHSDASWQMYRTVSGLIYLNPQDYEGGETYFKHFDLSIHPEEPAIVLFPSNYAYLHAAMPVTNGTKYVLVTWMNDMPRGFSAAILTNIAMSVGAMQMEQHMH